MSQIKHWIEKTASSVEQQARRSKGEGAKIICASGISPSGPIHLGNLREIMTVHLVTEGLKRRGLEAEHIHSWDDYDRLRKVPAGVPESFAEYIGQPVCDVPDPAGEFGSYAQRFMNGFQSNMERLGIRPRYIRQSEAYRRGDYNDSIKLAMRQRFRIFDILAEFQDQDRHEKSVEERRKLYYPFRVYCEQCNTDNTRVTDYQEASATIHYSCDQCSHAGSFSLDEKVSGKLVWKVDWPMRWKYEGVDFEPAGEDHSSPGSSFTVGKRIVKEIFDGQAPNFIGYAFVGMSGRSKLSSSSGAVATPGTALDILEPCMLRWLYIRRTPKQSFSIDFGKELLRLYDEWDRLVKKVADGKANEAETHTFDYCIKTSTDSIACSQLPVSFRLMSSGADITQGNVSQILRIVGDHLEDPPPAEQMQTQLEPRLSCAIAWANNYLPDDERTQIRDTFDADFYQQLEQQQKDGIKMLLENLDEYWSLKDLTKILYGVPKMLLGLPMDNPPTDEIKTVQRAFFVNLYQMICQDETGPRLPTLFLSLGQEKIRQLLTAESGNL